MTIENYDMLNGIFGNLNIDSIIDIVAILNKQSTNPDVNAILNQTLKELIYISKNDTHKHDISTVNL
jgi:hypothetical protein